MEAIFCSCEAGIFVVKLWHARDVSMPDISQVESEAIASTFFECGHKLVELVSSDSFQLTTFLSPAPSFLTACSGL